MQTAGHIPCKRLVSSDANEWSNGMQFPTEVTIVGSDMKLIHFIPNHVVETTVLISRVVVDIIEACSFFNSQNKFP